MQTCIRLRNISDSYKQHTRFKGYNTSMLQKGKHAKQSVVCNNRIMGATYKPFIVDMNIMNFNRDRHPNGFNYSMIVCTLHYQLKLN